MNADQETALSEQANTTQQQQEQETGTRKRTGRNTGPPAQKKARGKAKAPTHDHSVVEPGIAEEGQHVQEGSPETKTDKPANTPAKTKTVYMSSREMLMALGARTLIFGIVQGKPSEVTVLINPESKSQIRDDMTTLDVLAYANNPRMEYSAGSFTDQLLRLFDSLSHAVTEDAIAELISVAPDDRGASIKMTISKHVFHQRFARPCMLLASAQAGKGDRSFPDLCEKVFLETMTAKGMKKFYSDDHSEIVNNRKALMDTYKRMSHISNEELLAEDDSTQLNKLGEMAKSFPDVQDVWGAKAEKVALFKRIKAKIKAGAMSLDQIIDHFGLPCTAKTREGLLDYIKTDYGQAAYILIMEAMLIKDKGSNEHPLDRVDAFPCAFTLAEKLGNNLMESKKTSTLFPSDLKADDATRKDIMVECISLVAVMRVTRLSGDLLGGVTEYLNANRDKRNESSLSEENGAAAPSPITTAQVLHVFDQYIKEWGQLITNSILGGQKFNPVDYNIKTTFHKYLASVVASAMPDPNAGLNPDDFTSEYTCEFPDSMRGILKKQKVGISLDLEDYLHILFCELQAGCKHLSKPKNQNGLECLWYLKLDYASVVTAIKTAIKEGLGSHQQLLTVFETTEVKDYNLTELLLEDILFILVRENQQTHCKPKYTMQSYWAERVPSATGTARPSLLKFVAITEHKDIVDVDCISSSQTGAAAVTAEEAGAPAGDATAAEERAVEEAVTPSVAAREAGAAAGDMATAEPPETRNAIETGPGGEEHNHVTAAAGALISLQMGQETISHDTRVLRTIAQTILTDYPDFAPPGFTVRFTPPNLDKLVTALEEIYNGTRLDHVDADRLYTSAFDIVSHIHTTANPTYAWNSGFEKVPLDHFSTDDLCNMAIANAVHKAIGKQGRPEHFKLKTFTTKAKDLSSTHST